MDTWYEVEVEVATGRWAVLRRDATTKPQALQQVRELGADDGSRHAQDIRRGRAAKGSKVTIRKARVFKCTREES